MNINAPLPPEAPLPARSIQSYIDETPVWSDGTPLSWAPMTGMQWRIWMLAAAGKFFEGLVVFMTGVAMPLIAEEFNLNRYQHGVVGAASLFGILIGAIGLGGLAGPFRPQGDVHRRDDHLHDLPRAAGGEPRLLPARPLPVRARARARLRLSDRPPDHLRKHPVAARGGSWCSRRSAFRPSAHWSGPSSAMSCSRTSRRSARGAGCTRPPSFPPCW